MNARDRLRSWQFALRKRAPNVVRQGYRLARSALEAAPPSPDMPAHLLEGCAFYSSRLAMLDSLPKGGRVAEVGTLRGDFARAILQSSAPRELHLLDLSFSELASDVAQDSRVIKHEGLSGRLLGQFEPESFDWIYIDGDHSFEGSLDDARQAAKLIRPGGYLVFNDFAHIDPMLGRYGVHRAVTTFANEASWPMAKFAWQAYALYDVALRRPETPSGQ